MSTLNILWQRLMDERGQTCDRCGTTEMAVEEAVQKLKRSLKELDIDVVLEKKTLGQSTFLKDPLESNRIWIAGEPLEKGSRLQLVGASVVPLAVTRIAEL